MSAPYEADYVVTPKRHHRCNNCGGKLGWIYTHKRGKNPQRLVREQFRCEKCGKITEVNYVDRQQRPHKENRGSSEPTSGNT